jgi:hypothetical protein
MADASERHGLIYAALFQAAAPISPAGVLPTRERRELAYPTAMLGRLAEQFLEQELLDAGVAVRDSEGELIPAPSLARPHTALVPLQESGSEFPFDLLTPHGCLRGCSAAAMLRDAGLRQRIGEAHGYVLLATTWDDALWFGSAGLPVIYCPGLAELTIPLLRALTAEFDSLALRPTPSADSAGTIRCEDEQTAGGAETGLVDPHGASASENRGRKGKGRDHELDIAMPREANDRSRPLESEDDAVDEPLAVDPLGAERAGLRPTVVIVAWSPAAWSRDISLSLQSALVRFRQFDAAVPGALPELIVWSPSERQFACFELLVEFGEGKQLREVIIDSVEHDSRTLHVAIAEPSAADYIAARAEFRQALRDAIVGSIDEVDLAAKQRNYDRWLQQELIEPLLQRAARLSDPLERARFAAAAEICEEFHQMAPFVAARSHHSPEFSRDTSGPGEGGVRDMLALAKALGNLLSLRS